MPPLHKVELPWECCIVLNAISHWGQFCVVWVWWVLGGKPPLGDTWMSFVSVMKYSKWQGKSEGKGTLSTLGHSCCKSQALQHICGKIGKIWRTLFAASDSQESHCFWLRLNQVLVTYNPTQLLALTQHADPVVHEVRLSFMHRGELRWPFLRVACFSDLQI